MVPHQHVYDTSEHGLFGTLRFVHFGVTLSCSPNPELQNTFSEKKAFSTPETCLASLKFVFEKQR